jgi:pimeloyl-ACP methyl ester carboxylesterase
VRLRRKRHTLPLLLCALLAACVSSRNDEAADIAQSAGLAARRFDAGPFVLAAWQKPGRAGGGTLTVYLEGDGRAWINRGRVAENPTPDDPVALRLAAADPAPAVLYLARPCQYVEGPDFRHCAPLYWSTGRFAPDVVAATTRAIDIAKTETGAAKIELIGYSGGGVLALLVAARRQDVADLITVAAPLDTAAWTRHHGVSPLSDSLDPMAIAQDLAALPQVHFVGGNDEVVPREIVESYRRASGESAAIQIVSIAGYGHGCCWAENWPALVAQARGRRDNTGGAE